MQRQGTKLDFTGQDIFVGIDVHKKSWKVSIMLEELTHKTFSQDPDAKQLGNYLKKNFPGANYQSAYEAGFCGFSVHRKLSNEGMRNIVVNPSDIPTTHKDRKQKDDKRDSRKIARSLRNKELSEIYVPTPEIEELRSLLKCRADIVKGINRNKNRIKSILFYYGIHIPEKFQAGSKHFSKAYINWLESLTFNTWQGKHSLETYIDMVKILRSKLLDLNRQIRKTAKEENYKQDYNILVSVPGISMITAMNYIAEIVDVKRFRNNDHLCSFVGFIPSTNSSGENEKTGSVTSRSNGYLRSLLIESAWVAARTDPALSMTYHKLCKRMKPSKAIIRIAKRLLCRTRSLLINRQNYEYGIVK